MNDPGLIDSSYFSNLYAIIRLFPFYVVVSILFIGIGCKINIRDLFNQPALKKTVPLMLGMNYIVLPLLIAKVGNIFNIPGPIVLTLILICGCQGGGFAFLNTWLVKGNYHIQLWHMIINTCIAITILPYMFTFYGSMNNNGQGLLIDISIQGSFMLVSMTKKVLMPLAAGMVVKRISPKLASYLANKMIISSMIIVAVFLVLNNIPNIKLLKDYWNHFTYLFILYNVFVLIVTFSIPKLIGYSTANSIAISLSSSQLNIVLIMLILNTYFQPHVMMYMTVTMWSISSLFLPIIFYFLFWTGTTLLKRLINHHQMTSKNTGEHIQKNMWLAYIVRKIT